MLQPKIINLIAFKVLEQLYGFILTHVALELNLVQMFLDCGDQFFGPGNLTTDCVLKIDLLGSNCSCQPDLQIDAEEQYRAQQC